MREGEKERKEKKICLVERLVGKKKVMERNFRERICTCKVERKKKGSEREREREREGVGESE